AAIGIDRALRVKRGEAVPARDVAELRWSGGGMSMSRWRADDPIRRTDPVNEVVQPEALNTAHYAHVARHRETFGDAIDFSEVNRGLTPQEAIDEARRCFNCGVCNQCELCLIMCPDVAITRQEEGGFAIDLDYCKGCGICALECPRGAIVMTREGL
ncbi:MAG TPA: 4Fe-4S dicluster domain-containing protein, partial [Longimicrobiales bacterium]